MEYFNIKKSLSADILKKYHEKIRTYKLFFPRRLNIDGKEEIEYEPGKYCAEDKFSEVKDKKCISANPPNISNLNNAYLFDFQSKSEEDYDDIDREFLGEQDSYMFTEYEDYGLHTYGGYYGFFRPDLNEVINLISRQIKQEDLSDIIRIYVTTDAHPSDNIKDCYDSETDKHRAKTTYYVVKKK